MNVYMCMFNVFRLFTHNIPKTIAPTSFHFFFKTKSFSHQFNPECAQSVKGRIHLQLIATCLDRKQSQVWLVLGGNHQRPCGLMDKAPDFGSGDCRFESCHGRFLLQSRLTRKSCCGEGLLPLDPSARLAPIRTSCHLLLLTAAVTQHCTILTPAVKKNCVIHSRNQSFDLSFTC